jgi:Terpene cyclase DEP1
MVSLVVHALLGLTLIAVIIVLNPTIFRRVPTGPQLSALECVYYFLGIASVIVGWYFNIRFVSPWSHRTTNPFWGPGSYADYIRSMFVNPAASSAGQDYLFANAILLPLWTIVDGRRRGVRHPWLYFVASDFTSFTFAWAFYLATIERQRRMTRTSTHEPAAL